MKITIGTIVGIMAMPFIFMVLTFSLEKFGYYVCATGCRDLPEKFIAEHISPAKCFNIINLDFGPRPSTYEFQVDCFRDTTGNNPNVSHCMIESEYSSKCLNYLQSTYRPEDRCIETSSGYLACPENKLINIIRTNDCRVYPNTNAENWCHLSRTKNIPKVNDCEKISADQRDLYWECLVEFARKEKDSTTCNMIQDVEWKNLCLAWIE